MKYKIYIFIIILLVGITEVISQNNDHTIVTNQPSSELVSFVKLIETLNWRADPKRLDKVAAYKELDRDKIKLIDKKPFYSIDFNNARINSKLFKRFAKQNGFDFELFINAKSIWAYYYRGPKKADMISDGVIEQWEFENTEQATKALQMIKKSGSEIYFNTNPYFLRLANKLYIFQTRAMIFSLDDQIKVYKLFVKENAN